jgi:hypothetical protein
VELRAVAFDVAIGVLRAEGVEIHFDGAEMVETPGVPGDGVGEAEFHEGRGREIFDELGFDLLEDGAVFVGKGDDLASNIVGRRDER